jgi:hypothetical protein
VAMLQVFSPHHGLSLVVALPTLRSTTVTVLVQQV